MEHNTISFEKLIQLNSINLDGRAEELSKKKFWHYTSVTNGKSILERHCFYASALSKVNDRAEKYKNIQKEGKDFVLCFCNSESESIPLWYLYSGISGNGVRLGLTPGEMLKFLKSKEQMVFKAGNRILDTKDIEVSAGWVYYRRQDNLIIFKNKAYYIEQEELEKVRETMDIYEKDYPWEYEKEFRIVFHTSKKIKEDRLKVTFPENFVKKIRIGYGPEYDVGKKTSDCQYLEKLIPADDKTKSKIQINMCLLKKNIKSIVDELPDLLVDKYIQENIVMEHLEQLYKVLKEKCERKG